MKNNPTISTHCVKRLGLLSLFLAVILAAGAASGDVVLSDNLNASWSGFNQVVGITSPEIWHAQEFSTDSSSYLLDSVTLGFRNDQGDAVPPTPELAIYSDNGGLPGVSLGVLTPPDFSAGLPAFPRYTAADISLFPSTNYWMVLTVDSGFRGWDATLDSAAGTGPGYSVMSAYTGDSGADWTSINYAPLVMQVTASPVPEPNAVTTMFVAAGAIALTACSQAVARAHRGFLSRRI